jgi:hypothetical protein
MFILIAFAARDVELDAVYDVGWFRGTFCE